MSEKEGIERLFEKFWDAYPKKERRAEARRVFLTIAPDDALTERMIAVVNAFARTETWQCDNGRYVPQAFKWLMEERWEDTPQLSKEEDAAYAESFCNAAIANTNRLFAAGIFRRTDE